MTKREGMKKFLLTSVCATAMGFASAALAGEGNKAYLSQDGDDHSALITQSGGNSNTVGTSLDPFLQEDGTGTGANVLVINQNSTSAGSGNSANGFQSGSLNNVNIDQEGSDSSVVLQQTGAKNGPTGPGSGDPWFNGSVGNLILQDATTDTSSVSLIQTNDVNALKGNVFNIGQGGENNEIDATQTGFNKLWIRQGTTAPDLWSWTFGNFFDPANPLVDDNSLGTLSDSTITVEQSRSSNMDGNAASNYAALGQGGGSENEIDVSQSSGANSVDANQVGSNNIFVSTQINTGAGWNFIGGEAGWPDSSVNPLTGVAGDFRPVLQDGDGNDYNATQNGSNLVALGSQIGDGNLLTSNQLGDGSSLYTTQTGDSNEIDSSQSGTDNTGTVTQTGDGNVTSLSQNGSLNVATVTQ